MRSPVPHVGHWYKDMEAGHIFEVVAYDNHAHTIEIQLLAGEVDEYDVDTWAQLELVPVEEPEDWRNPYEIDPEDDIQAAEEGFNWGWDDPVGKIEPDAINGLLDVD